MVTDALCLMLLPLRGKSKGLTKTYFEKKKIRQKVSIKRFFFSCLYNCCCFYVEGIPNKRRRRRRDKSSILFVSYAFCGLCAAKKRTLKKKGKHTKTNSYPFEAAPFLLRVVSCAQLVSLKKTLKRKGKHTSLIPSNPSWSF